MSVITVGLIGYGLAGASFHAPLVRSVAELRLATVVTSRREQVDRDLPGVNVAATVDELLAEPGIELVVVASPTSLHAEHARAALLAGKHVVVDKPLAATAHEADALMALAASSNRMLSVFQNRRWDGDFLTLQHCLAQRSLGEVVHYEAHYDRFRPTIKTGWREEERPGSGLVYDLGAHLVDQALQLFGMPNAVTADVLAQRPAAKVSDYMHLVLDYGRARAILHAATLVAAPGPRFVVHGDGGSFVKYGLDGQEAALREGRGPGSDGWGLDAEENYARLTAADGSVRTIPTLPGAYQRFYELVAAHLRAGGPLPVDPHDARDGLLVIEAALLSARERRTVPVLR